MSTSTSLVIKNSLCIKHDKHDMSTINNKVIIKNVSQQY